MMTTDTRRYLFFGALGLLAIVAVCVAVAGLAVQVAVVLAPLFILLVLAYLAIHLWAHSRVGR